MTQTINFDDLRRNHTAADVIFIRAVMAAGEVHSTADGKYDLEFKVEGKEVDFLKFCESFEHHHDAAINAAAEKKLEEMSEFRELRDKLDEVRDAAMSKVNALLAEFQARQL
jgi:hypothetical protein